jgi:ABC-type phosphate transport system substrate-binding protein
MAALLLALDGAVAADSFVVIVNEAEPAAALSAQEVSNLFLKKSVRLPSGIDAAPIDLAESSPERASFSKRVHGKSTSAIKSYWQRLIFSGRAVPPPEAGSPADVVAFVRAQRGAIGYVPQGTPLGPGVKVVVLTP